MIALIAGSCGLAMGGGIPAPMLYSPELWLRADLGVTLVSSAVSSWADQSGHGRDATQGTSANRPTLTSNSANGRPGVTFNGATSNAFLAGSLGSLARDPFTIFAVSKMSTGTQSGGIVDATTSGGHTNVGQILLQNGSNRSFRFASATDLQYAFTSTSVMAHFAVCTHNGVNSETKELFEKTTSKGTAGVAAGASTLTQYRIGRLFDNVFPFSGDILEVALYSVALNATQIGILSSYAAALYGL